jgi:allophanate hydrolase
MMTERAAAFSEALDRADRPEIWIDLVGPDEVGEPSATGPLAGLLLAVKNNVDVAGLPTTAACPGYASAPATADADAVARLRAAGATVVGSTNMDQFATGLVGQRSPYGGVRDARRPEHISGGSSSGSAVAVALGLADIAIGTDTAGSGRVPAAFGGIVGIKPTLGLVSTRGVVPACRSWDAVTIMARDIETANTAMGVMSGGPGTRTLPDNVPLAAPAVPRIAVPRELPGMSTGWTEAFDRVAERLRADGAVVQEISFTSFLEAARLLYDGGLVAERHAAVGDYVDAHLGEVDPVVGRVISAAGSVTASQMVRDLDRLDRLRSESMESLADCDVLLVPTVPGHPSIAEVAADPIGVNSWLGTYTNFANLFDMCAVAVPAGTVGAAQFGITVLGRTFHDAVALDVARRVIEVPDSVAAVGAAAPLPPGPPWIESAGAAFTDVFVVGAHLPGQPLEHEMTSRGGRFIAPDRTAASYELYALPTNPPKPGLVRVASAGTSIAGGVWRLPAAALSSFLGALPEPMMLGSVNLTGGRSMVGFGCQSAALEGALNITEYGGWLAYLDGQVNTPHRV